MISLVNISPVRPIHFLFGGWCTVASLSPIAITEVSLCNLQQFGKNKTNVNKNPFSIEVILVFPCYLCEGFVVLLCVCAHTCSFFFVLNLKCDCVCGIHANFWKALFILSEVVFMWCFVCVCMYATFSYSPLWGRSVPSWDWVTANLLFPGNIYHCQHLCDWNLLCFHRLP